MNKKKIGAMGLAAALAATAMISGSLAYFTDNEQADNVFEVGGVDIVLNEQQRGENGLETFQQNKVLLPIVGSAQGNKDAYGMPVAANYCDKMVSVTNEGESDSWVRVYFAIPSSLDDGFETFNAGLNSLHFNFGNKSVDGKWVTTYGTDWNWKNQKGGWNYFETEMNGIRYNVYFGDYMTVLPAGQTTSDAVSGVYLDKHVDVDKDGNLVDVRNGVTTQLGFTAKDQIVCPVFAIAAQSAGFDTSSKAFDEAFGAKFNPWGGVVENWQ